MWHERYSLEEKALQDRPAREPQQTRQTLQPQQALQRQRSSIRSPSQRSSCQRSTQGKLSGIITVSDWATKEQDIACSMLRMPQMLPCLRRTLQESKP